MPKVLHYIYANIPKSRKKKTHEFQKKDTWSVVVSCSGVVSASRAGVRAGVGRGGGWGRAGWCALAVRHFHSVCAEVVGVSLGSVVPHTRGLYFVFSLPEVLCNFRCSESFLSSAARLDCVICKEECRQLNDSAATCAQRVTQRTRRACHHPPRPHLHS